MVLLDTCTKHLEVGTQSSHGRRLPPLQRCPKPSMGPSSAHHVDDEVAQDGSADVDTSEGVVEAHMAEAAQSVVHDTLQWALARHTNQRTEYGKTRSLDAKASSGYQKTWQAKI